MGDFQGHPFRGNQYTTGVGTASGAFKEGENREFRDAAGPDTYEGEKRGAAAYQQALDAGLSGERQRRYEAAYHGYVGREQEPLELAVRGLASWTTSAGDANDFAGPKGHIVATRIKAEDVWMQSGLGSRGVIRYMEDAEEIVTINRTSTRKVTYARGGSKIQKRMGSGFLGYSGFKSGMSK